MKTFTFITGSISFMLVPMGILFKMMHWPGANILMVIGIGLFALLFVPSFAKYKYDRAK